MSAPGTRPTSVSGRAGGPALEIPGFEVIEEVGGTARGRVFRALQRGLGRQVAIEVLEPIPAEPPPTARLAHPGIPPVHALVRDEAAGRAYLAAKLVRGTPWSELLGRERDLRKHLDILRRACDALAYARSRGVAHGDLRSEDVVVGEFGEIFVTGWGRASREDDVVALGRLLERVLAAVERPPEALLAAAARAVESDPARRFAGPAEFAAAIDEYFRQAAVLGLVDVGVAELEAAIASSRTARPAEVYGRFAGAAAALKQAAELAPGNAAIASRLVRARVAFAAYAIENDDLALAEAQLDRVPPDATGAAAVRARLAALRERREAEGRRRRRLVAGIIAAAGLAVIVMFVAARASRRVGALEAARERRQRAEAEVEAASWGEWQSKVAATERALAIDPLWPEGWARLGHLLTEAEREPCSRTTDARAITANFLRACVAYDWARALAPADPLAISDRAYCATVLGDWGIARTLYRTLAAIAPDRHEGWEAAGVIALSEGRYADAEREFTRCIERGPQKFDWFQRAAARYALGEVDRAHEDLLNLVSLDSTDEWYQAGLALVLLARGDFREAGKLIRAALERDDEGPHLLPLLAYRAALLGDRERARAVLERARAAQRKYERVLLALEPYWTPFARAPTPLDGPGRAVLLDLDIDRLAPAEPSSSVLYRREAESLLASNDPAGALAAASRALAEDPADGAALFARGRAFAALGHAAAARRDLAAVEVLAPEREAEARAALEALGGGK
jgi:tetratricopeptide (TPR) repeat protein